MTWRKAQPLRLTLLSNATPMSILLRCLLFAWLAVLPSNSRAAEPAELARQLVERQREIIVLTQDLAQVPDATRSSARLLGRQLFHDQLELREQLAQAWSEALLRPTADLPPSLDAALDLLEATTPWHDADKLALRESVDTLLLAVLERDVSSAPEWRTRLAARLLEDQAALATIQARYETEMQAVAASLRLRAMPLRRESWSQYLAFLDQQGYRRDTLLKRYAARLNTPDVSHGGMRGAHEGEGPDLQAVETFGRQLPDKTLLLTFDDGPHPRHTDAVLAILGRYGLTGVFFAVGRNIGKLNDSGTPVYDRRAEVSRRVLAAGSVLGNHSYTHANLPKLDAATLTREIGETQALLKSLAPDTPPLFRPPYGARNKAVLTELGAQALRSIQWNIDSMDWSDPVASSVADRVIAEVEKQGRGIILFHDIHTRAVDALPTVLDTLIARGYRFARWDGKDFTVDGAAVPVIPPGATDTAPPAAGAPYRESWAVVIGIDDYEHWPRLGYAVNDARGVEALLKEKFGFRDDHVFNLHDRVASRANLLSLLGDYLGDPRRVQREDRVFVFFAGHGATRPLASGRDLGYIIPADGKTDALQGTAISMSNFQDIADAIPAKHLLFVMDSCYSGLALTRGGGAADSRNYLAEIARRQARQIYTAGGADQQVADSGPGGHSVFTWALLRGLGGESDLNGDGVITATELATWTSPMVASMSRQTPAFGNLPGSEGGEFFFTLKPEDQPLNGLSARLDVEAGELDAELRRLREQIAAKSQRNSALAQQLAAAQRSLAQMEAAPAGAERSAADTESAIQHNEAGTALYQRQDYAGALGEFLTAARLDPAYALAANNVGFVYFKLGQHQDAADWYERTLRIDPQRAVAWINAADAYVELGRTADAAAAYQRFLELRPESGSA